MIWHTNFSLKTSVWILCMVCACDSFLDFYWMGWQLVAQRFFTFHAQPKPMTVTQSAHVFMVNVASPAKHKIFIYVGYIILFGCEPELAAICSLLEEFRIGKRLNSILAYEFFVRLENQRLNVPKWNEKFPHRREWNRIEMEFEIGTELNADRIALRRTYGKFVNTIFIFSLTIRLFARTSYTLPCTNSHQPNEQWTSSEVHNEQSCRMKKKTKLKQKAILSLL